MDDTTGPHAAGQSKPIESPIGYADIDLLDLNWRYRKTLCALLRAGDGSTRRRVFQALSNAIATEHSGA
jgi:hypothetical protein